MLKLAFAVSDEYLAKKHDISVDAVKHIVGLEKVKVNAKANP